MIRNIDARLREYVEGTIIPQYDGFDPAHRRDHVEMVISQSLQIAAVYPVRVDMVYAIAAYHDTGLCKGRETHHMVSGSIVRNDGRLREFERNTVTEATSASGFRSRRTRPASNHSV